MTMLYVLIPLALMLLVIAVWAMLWAIRTGQFDDLESQGWSVVLDDDQKPPQQDESYQCKLENACQDRDGQRGSSSEQL